MKILIYSQKHTHTKKHIKNGKCDNFFILQINSRVKMYLSHTHTHFLQIMEKENYKFFISIPCKNKFRSNQRETHTYKIKLNFHTKLISF